MVDESLKSGCFGSIRKVKININNKNIIAALKEISLDRNSREV